MTKAFITMIICLTTLVLTGGGWAEELLAPKCFGDRCYEMSSLRDPPDGNWNCWDASLGVYVYGELTEQCDYITFFTVDSPLTITAPEFSTTNDISIKYDREKFDKLVFHEIKYYNKICFQLKGDDVERCVETEWLYKWLKMMQP